MDYYLFIKQLEQLILPHLPEEQVKSIFLNGLKKIIKELNNREFKLKRTIQDKQITTNVLENTINELKILGENLKHQKTLTEEQAAFKENLFANLSHELRTPLHGILGMSYLLENTLLNEEQQEYLDIIRGSADNLLVIINDLLNFSKINAGKTLLINEPFSVNLTFELPAPAAIKNVQNNKSELIIPEDWQNKHILMIEDNVANLIYAQNLFARGNVTLIIAEDLAMAQQEMREKKFDCILSDVKLPDGNGMDLIAEIRGDNTGINQKTPIIVLTASANEKEALRAKKLNVQSYIGKPFPPQLLIDEMKKILNKGKNRLAPKTSSPNLKQEEVSTLYFAQLEKHFKGKSKLQIEMLDIFLNQLSQAMEQMDKGLKENDLKIFHYDAHRIKSTIDIIGLPHLKSIITKLDDYCYNKIHLDQLPELFQQFKKQATEDVKLILAKKEDLYATN